MAQFWTQIMADKWDAQVSNKLDQGNKHARYYVAKFSCDRNLFMHIRSLFAFCIHSLLPHLLVVVLFLKVAVWTFRFQMEKRWWFCCAWRWTSSDFSIGESNWHTRCFWKRPSGEMLCYIVILKNFKQMHCSGIQFVFSSQNWQSANRNDKHTFACAYVEPSRDKPCLFYVCARVGPSASRCIGGVASASHSLGIEQQKRPDVLMYGKVSIFKICCSSFATCVRLPVD